MTGVFIFLILTTKVIPQLIARIDTPRPLVGRLIHQLLTDIGRYHPQVSVSLEEEFSQVSVKAFPVFHFTTSRCLHRKAEQVMTVRLGTISVAAAAFTSALFI